MPVGIATPETFHADLIGLTADLDLRFQDIAIPARGWPLEAMRVYSATAEAGSGFGPGWGWSYGVRLGLDRATGLIQTLEIDGSISFYDRPEERGLFGAARTGRLDSAVTERLDGTWTRLFADGTAERFDRRGRLVARYDALGLAQTISLDDAGRPVAVEAVDGRSLTITWDGDRVATITDPIGRTHRYAYDDSGRLASATDPLGRSTAYGYDADGRLTNMALADGTVMAFRYDTAGKLTRVEGPGRLATDVAFSRPDSDTRRLVVTDAEGRRTETTIVMRDDRVEIDVVNGEGEVTQAVIVDGELRVSRAGGAEQVMTFDEAGRPQEVRGIDGDLIDVGVPDLGIGPAEEERTYTYDDRGLPEQEYGEAGRVLTPVFDDAGRMTALLHPDGLEERFEFDAGDRLLSYTDVAGRVARYAWDDGDRLVSETGIRGNTTTLAYDDAGLLLEVVQPPAPPVRYSYDAAGFLIREELATGAVGYVYDRAGRLVATEDADGNRTEAVFRADGLVDRITDPRGYTVFLTYDADGRPTGINDSLGREMVMEVVPDGLRLQDFEGWVAEMVWRDDGGVSAAVASPSGETATLHEPGPLAPERPDDAPPPIIPEVESRVDEAGRLVEVVEAPGVVHRLNWSDGGDLLRIEPAGGIAVDVEYDTVGRPVVMRAADGQTYSLTYDEFSQIATETDALGNTVTYAYDQYGRIVEASAPDGTWTWAYDAFDNIVREVAPAGAVVERTYDDRQRLVEERYTDGTADRRTRYEYNALGDVVRTIHPHGVVEEFERDILGRLVEIRVAGVSTRFDYDLRGRLRAIHRLGETETFAYDADGRPLGDDGRVAGTSTIAFNGASGPEVTERDAAGRPISLRLSDGTVHQLSWTATGLLAGLVDEGGRRWAFEHDELGRLVAAGPADGPAERFRYDDLGRIAGVERTGGGILAIARDDQGRVIEQAAGDGHRVVQEYDDFGRLVAVEDDLGRHTMAYDAGGRLVSVTDPWGRTLTYRYDPVGRLSAMVTPEGETVTYRYNAIGDLTAVTGIDGITAAIENDEAGRVEAVAVGDAVRAEFIYRGMGLELAALETVLAGQSLGQRLERGDADRVVGLETDEGRWAFDYDDRGRLAAVTRPDGAVDQYAYDASDNIVDYGDGVARTYDNAWRLTAIGDRPVTHDADGNLTAVEGGPEFLYDAVGQLTRAVAPDGTTVDYRYDYLGRLAERRAGDDIRRYLWHADRLIGVYDGEGVRQVWIERPVGDLGLARIHTPEGVTAIATDLAGTPAGILGPDGAVDRPAMQPWGHPPARGPPDLPLGYNGAPVDPDLGLVFFGARVYAPDLGRFLTPDPAGVRGGANPYAYALNAPIDHADLTGLTSIPRSFFGPSNIPPRPRGFTPNNGTLPGVARQYVDDLLLIAQSGGNSARDIASRQIALEALRTLRRGGNLSVSPFESGRGPGNAGPWGHVTGRDVRRAHVFREAIDETIDTAVRRGGMVGTQAERVRAGAAVAAHELRHVDQAHRAPGIRPFGPRFPGGHVAHEMEAYFAQWHLDPRMAGMRGGRTLSLRELIAHVMRVHPSGMGHLTADQVVDVVRHYRPDVAEGVVRGAYARASRQIQAERAAAQAARRGAGGVRPGARQSPQPPRRGVAPRAPTGGRGVSPRRPTQRIPGLADPPTRPGATGPRPTTTGGSRPPVTRGGGPRPPRPTTGTRPTGGAGPGPSTGGRTPGSTGTRPTRGQPPRPTTGLGGRTTRPTSAGTRTATRVRVGTGGRGPVVHPPGVSVRPTGWQSALGKVGRVAGFGLGVLDLAWNYKRLWDGDIGFAEWAFNHVFGIGLMLGFVPWPVAGFVLAIQLGKALGQWLADLVNQFLRSDHPLVPWLMGLLRRLGLLNANDPTFVAMPPRWPPRLGSPRPASLSPGVTVAGGTVWLPEPASVRVTVVSADGRVVRELGRVSAWRGPLHLDWDGLDADGQPSPDGTYLLVADAAMGEDGPIDLPAWSQQITVDATPPAPAIEGAAVNDAGVLSATGAGLEPAAWTRWSLIDADGNWWLLAEGTGTLAFDTVQIPTGGSARLILETRDAAGNWAMAETAIELGDSSGQDVVVAPQVSRLTSLTTVTEGWETADRSPALIDGPVSVGTDAGETWTWQEDAGPFGGPVHVSTVDGVPVRTATLAEPVFVGQGDRLVQYLRLDVDAPPVEIVLGLYDDAERLAGAVSFGTPSIDVVTGTGEAPDRLDDGLPTGIWLRVSLPVEDLGLPTGLLGGLLFAAAGGDVLWGPTTLAANDEAPTVTRLGENRQQVDETTALRIEAGFPDEGSVDIAVETGEGERLPVATVTDGAGPRRIDWPALRSVDGAVVVFSREGDDAAELRVPVPDASGTAGLVAEILFPPERAVGRQTVPIFGRAGGEAFARYVVDYRPAGAGEDVPWSVLTDSSRPRTIDRAQIASIVDRTTGASLRGTVYGNLASIHLGSANHRFEFRPADPLVPPDRLVIRLRVFDEAGAVAEDRVTLSVGEVASSPRQSRIPSPDGGAHLTIPPFSLPDGQVAVAIERAPLPSLPEGATAASAAYAIGPADLALTGAATVHIAVEASDEVALWRYDADHGWMPLATETSEEGLSAPLTRFPSGMVVAALTGMSDPLAVLLAAPPALTGRAIPGATVALEDTEGAPIAETTAGPDGLFTLPRPEAGALRLRSSTGGALDVPAWEDASVDGEVEVDTATAVSPAAPAAPQVTRADANEPLFTHDFEMLVSEPWSGEGVLELGTVTATTASRATRLIDGPLTLDPSAVLSFAYRLSPGATLDLIVRGDGGVDVNRLAGADPLPVENGAFRPVIVPRLIDDGAWHMRVIPLGAVLGSRHQRVDAVDLGLLRAPAWQTYFIDAIAAEDSALIDAVRLGPGLVTAEEALSVRLQPADGAAGALVALGDAEPVTTDTGETELSLPAPVEGLHALTLRSRDAEGGAGPAVRWPVLVDRSVPAITDLSPTPEDASGQSAVSAVVTDAGIGVDPASIAMTINGDAVPSDLIDFDAATGRVALVLNDLPDPPRLESGNVITATITAGDLLGNALAEPVSWQWTVDVDTLAVGPLTRLTFDGGSQPAWAEDGTLIYVAPTADGASVLRSLDPDTAEVTDLTPVGEWSSPDIDGGRILAVRDDELLLLDGEGFGNETSLGSDLRDPAWLADGRFVAARGSAVMLGMLDGPTVAACRAEQGGTVHRPRPVDARTVVFGQQAYHQTLWLCDLETGTVRPLSQAPDDPDTRDYDADASGGLIVHADGAAAPGLWLTRPDGGDRNRLLAADRPGERWPSLEPDGTRIAFQSDRSGIDEIWMMSLGEAPEITLQTTVFDPAQGPLTVTVAPETAVETIVTIVGSADAILAVLHDGVLEEAAELTWSGTDENGAALTDGAYEVVVTVADGALPITARRSVAIDTTGPTVAAYRAQDGLPIGPETPLPFGGRFRVAAEDGPWGAGVATIERQVGDAWTALADPGQARLPAGPLSLRAIDRLGHVGPVVELALPVIVAELEEPEAALPAVVETVEDAAGEPADDQADRTWWWLLLILLGLLLGGGAAYARRRSRMRRGA